MKSPRSLLLSVLSLDTKPSTSSKFFVALATVTPCCCTTCGSRGCASCSLFCTCTCAMSGLVPWAKFSVMVMLPSLSLSDERYSRLSMPLSCCSITCTTVLCTVSAEAPG